jgi:Flp pilus assembly pilin Flp
MIETYLLRISPVLRRLKNKRGQTLVEYALILALISVVAITTLSAMGVQVSSVFTTINRQVAIAGNGGPAAAPPGHGG